MTPHDRDRNNDNTPLDTGEFARAVAQGIDDKFIQWAEDYWKEHKDRREAVSTSQIRNVFGTVKRMEMNGFSLPKFLLLQARLRYAASRVKKQQEPLFKHFAETLIIAVKTVGQGTTPAIQEERFTRFCQGFEAILAYHRAYGGK